MLVGVCGWPWIVHTHCLPSIYPTASVATLWKVVNAHGMHLRSGVNGEPMVWFHHMHVALKIFAFRWLFAG